MPYYQKKDIAEYFVAVKDCPAFGEVYGPDDRVNDDGIYGCCSPGCKYEVVRHKDEQLPHEPTCAGHPSTGVFTPHAQPGEVTIYWRLRALAQRNPNK